MGALAPLRIDGPPPVAPAFSLVTTPGTILDETDEHWQGGVALDVTSIDTPLSWDPCSTGSARTKDIGSAPPAPIFSSFTVYLAVTCSAIGIGNEAGADRLRGLALLGFQAVESFGVERELSQGDASTSKPFLADGSCDVLVGNVAVGPREALSRLEGAIGTTAKRGMVHCDAATFDAWAAWDLVEANGATMLTRRGNIVIIGDGYAGAVPSGGSAIPGAPNDDVAYAFATGPVRLTRGDPIIYDTTLRSLDRDLNDITFRAERNYVAYWDTALQVAVRVDRSASP